LLGKRNATLASPGKKKDAVDGAHLLHDSTTIAGKWTMGKTWSAFDRGKATVQNKNMRFSKQDFRETLGQECKNATPYLRRRVHGSEIFT
jgi:hypothetical protein